MTEEIFKQLTEHILAFIERFKYIDKAVDNLCKKLSKISIDQESFAEFLKIYNTTGQMYTKSLELLDSIICRFPVEITPDELELLDQYRKMSESEKFLFKETLKLKVKQNAQ